MSEFYFFYTFSQILKNGNKGGAMMEPTDDKELYLKLKEGDERAFKALFEKYYAFLCHFASQFLNDSEMAEEIVQELFVRIWEKRESLTIETSVKHYFFKSVKNQCLNQLQHQKIKLRYAGKVKETSHQDIDPSQNYIEVDLFERIEKSIDSMPKKRQEIFRLSREQGLKYKEIAEQLNISIKTVEAQMGLALKYLREELKDFSNHFVSMFFVLKNRGFH